MAFENAKMATNEASLSHDKKLYPVFFRDQWLETIWKGMRKIVLWVGLA